MMSYGAREQSADVLVVDDTVLNRVLALKQLEKLGYSGQAVANGEAAVLALREGSYSVVLMDRRMPGMDGLETTRAIRSEEGDSRHVAIVAMTASSSEEDREACLDAGMDDFVSKPVMLGALATTLERWAPPGRTSDLPDPLRRGLSPDIVRMFLSELSEWERTIHSAAESLDYEGLESSAHALRSPCSFIGAAELAAVCAEIEDLARGRDLAGAVPVLDDLRRETRRVATSFNAWLERVDDRAPRQASA